MVAIEATASVVETLIHDADVLQKYRELEWRLHDRRSILGSIYVAKSVAQLLSAVVAQLKVESVGEMLIAMKSCGIRLINARPRELAIANIVRRVLHAIRQESAADASCDLSVSLVNLSETNSGDLDASKLVVTPNLRERIAESISELISELESVRSSIAMNASDHVHARETILTHDFSSSVLQFLITAARERAFHVIVLESAPGLRGRLMAKQLAEAGIRTTVIPDASVFAMMSRVNKVIIGTQGVLKNGGLLAQTGVQNIALAAKHHAVPLLVLTGVYKICPLLAFDQDSLNVHGSPSELCEYGQAYMPAAQVVNPAFDYVLPEYVTLFITNTGVFNASYIYRLLLEMYHRDDEKLSY